MDFIKASLVGLLSVTLMQCSSANKRVEARNQADETTKTVAQFAPVIEPVAPVDPNF